MLGQVVEDRYLVEAELGAGAMGRVYRARHVKVGRQVALKVMHREYANVPAIVERFAREALIAARVRHPNLVSVLDVGTMPDCSPMIVLELAPGNKLASLIDGPMPRERVVAIVRQLLLGLDHAHAAGLIHRDLKPDNILVETSPDGRDTPRIVDFGIAVTRERDDSVAGRRLTEANTVIGTPFYMSPEQARGEELDTRTDLFSLGVIMYELLAGMLPFGGTSVDAVLAMTGSEAPTIRERAGIDVDPLLEAVVRRLMARRREDRFASARDALAALDLVERDRVAASRVLGNALVVVDLADREPVTAEASAHVPAHPRRTRGWIVGGAALLAIASSIAWWPATHSAATSAVIDVNVVATPDVDTQLAQREVVVAARESEIEDASVTTKPTTTRPRMSRTLVAPTMAAAPVLAPARDIATAIVTREQVDVDQPVPNDSAAVAARYIAVGKALRGAPDELWQRYRRIRINDVLQTAATRQQTIDTLAQIEAALAR
jgi:tRNA A-37 threonylcarbamoyl transferase component Bud32